MFRDDFFFWFGVALMGAFYLGVSVGHVHGYNGPLAQWQRYFGSAVLIVIGFLLVGLRYITAKMGAQ